MSFYYVFGYQWSKFQSDKSVPHKFDANDTWENVRYKLETLFKLHDRKRPQFFLAKFATSFQHTSYKDFENVDDQKMILPHDLLVLIRKPLPSYLRSYTPVSAVITDYSDCATEDDAIAKMLQHTSVRSKHAHASKWDGVIPPWYSCYKCGALGSHDTRDCKQPVLNFVHIKKRCSIAGIPKSELRLATPQEIRVHSLIDENGQHWVRKNQLL